MKQLMNVTMDLYGKQREKEWGERMRCLNELVYHLWVYIQDGGSCESEVTDTLGTLKLGESGVSAVGGFGVNCAGSGSVVSAIFVHGNRSVMKVHAHNHWVTVLVTYQWMFKFNLHWDGAEGTASFRLFSKGDVLFVMSKVMIKVISQGGSLAQGLEHWSCKPGVMSSNLIGA